MRKTPLFSQNLKWTKRRRQKNRPSFIAAKRLAKRPKDLLRKIPEKKPENAVSWKLQDIGVSADQLFFALKIYNTTQKFSVYKNILSTSSKCAWSAVFWVFTEPTGHLSWNDSASRCYDPDGTAVDLDVVKRNKFTWEKGEESTKMTYMWASERK